MYVPYKNTLDNWERQEQEHGKFFETLKPDP